MERLMRMTGVACCAYVALTGAATAQESRGTIAGTVRDTSMAVVPGASVTITNVAMGTSVPVVTNEAGVFQAPYLIPGTYRVVVELTGFKRYVRDEVPLRVGDKLELDVVLELGRSEETVNVTASAPLLETTSASLGSVVDARRVSELPTPHGDPYALIFTAPRTTTRRRRRSSPTTSSPTRTASR